MAVVVPLDTNTSDSPYLDFLMATRAATAASGSVQPSLGQVQQLLGDAVKGGSVGLSFNDISHSIGPNLSMGEATHDFGLHIRPEGNHDDPTAG